MTPLRWTRTPPTEAGWWWWLERQGCIPEVVQVCFGSGQHGRHEGQIVFHQVEVEGQYGTPGPAMWWAGPIAPPEEPRSGDPEAAEEEGS